LTTAFMLCGMTLTLLSIPHLCGGEYSRSHPRAVVSGQW
jgi:hypothetical protein